MANTVTSHDLQPGVKWTFVHTSGKRTEYVYKRQMVARAFDPAKHAHPLDAMHALLNPETGKLAQVTEKWLCEGPVGANQHGHWLLGA